MNKVWQKTISAGFTVVELLIVVVVIGILAGITTVGYGAWQEDIQTSAVKSDLSLAVSGLESYQNFNNSYTRNMAATQFVPSETVAVVPYTNATSQHVDLPYTGLSDAQNVSLFLFSCSAEMQNVSRSCGLNGNNNGAKIHIPGTVGSNTLWRGDICTSAGQSSDCETILTADCDGVPLTNCNNIVSTFTAQGGEFPVVLSGGQDSLPVQPGEEAVDETTPITKYCLQANGLKEPDVIYHVLSSDKSNITSGPCPNDPELSYLP